MRRRFCLTLSSVLVACASAQPLVDDEVWMAFDRAPMEEHPLILTIELVRRPLDLGAMLPSAGEYNTCTEAWLAWEDLLARRDAGEGIADEEVELALLIAELADGALDAKQESAYAAYHADYDDIVAQSVPPVVARLQATLGKDEVRWPSEHVQFLTIDADVDEFDVLLLEDAITRISHDVEFVGALDVSRLSIRADEVHDGVGNLGPYTGDGVKVAIVDSGYDESHPRLPLIASGDKYDWTIDSGGTAHECSNFHGSFVAGVVFCQPDEGDDYVGIAYEATPVNAKVYASKSHGTGCATRDIVGETWANTQFPGLDWAFDTAAADVANLSRHGIDEGDSTLATATTALNADWLVYSYGSSITHSCGNEDQFNRLAPPSGSYNIISVGGYDDNNTETRSDDEPWDNTSPGPTQDERRKPDLCAPSPSIYSTDPGTDGFTANSGTSFAAPHVAGTIALMLEARPSLTPRQIHAILVNATDRLDCGTCDEWHIEAGWGALDAYRAVQHRNRISDNELAPEESKTWVLQDPDPDEEVVITVAWQREMEDASEAYEDSPHDLNLYLDGKLPNGNWTQLAASETGEISSGDDTYNNIEQVRFFQNPSNEDQYQFRVRVVRAPGNTNLAQQEFTVASRHGFSAIPPL